MFFSHIIKRINISLIVLCTLFVILVLIILFGKAGAQFLPYVPFSQYYGFPANYSFANSALSLLSSGLVNPYAAVFNPVSFYNPYAAFSSFAPVSGLAPINSVSAFPQATVAGGLVPLTPFVNPFISPVVNPYVAAAYFAAVTIDVSGSWTGQWVSTFLAGGVLAGDISITLSQTGTEVTGTAVFLLNKILKYGAAVVGIVEGNVLTLTSTVVTSPLGTMTFDVTIVATVTDLTMEGTYEVINLVTGLIAEQGTFTAARI